MDYCGDPNKKCCKVNIHYIFPLVFNHHDECRVDFNSLCVQYLD